MACKPQCDGKILPRGALIVYRGFEGIRFPVVPEAFDYGWRHADNDLALVVHGPIARPGISAGSQERSILMPYGGLHTDHPFLGRTFGQAAVPLPLKPVFLAVEFKPGAAGID